MGPGGNGLVKTEELTESHNRFSKLDSLALGAAGKPQDFRRNGVQWKNTIGEPGLCYGSGHSPDGAGGLILRKDYAALLTDKAAAVQAVITHPSQHERENAGAVDSSGGTKEHIDRGAAVVDWFVAGETKDCRRNIGGRCGGGGCCDLHVAAALRDVDMAGADGLAGNGFVDMKRAAAVETLGKQLCEELRHMLHDEDGQWEVRGELGQNQIESRWTSGRDTYENHGRRRIACLRWLVQGH